MLGESPFIHIPMHYIHILLFICAYSTILYQCNITIAIEKIGLQVH